MIQFDVVQVFLSADRENKIELIQTVLQYNYRDAIEHSLQYLKLFFLILFSQYTGLV